MLIGDYEGDIEVKSRVEDESTSASNLEAQKLNQLHPKNKFAFSSSSPNLPPHH